MNKIIQAELDNLEKIIAEKLQNPNFRNRWKEMDGDYQFVKLVIQNRLALNMTRRDLAEKADTSLAVISRIESLSTCVRVEMARRIANALGKELQIRFV